jgi:hypothetical protein
MEELALSKLVVSVTYQNDEFMDLAPDTGPPISPPTRDRCSRYVKRYTSVLSLPDRIEVEVSLSRRNRR